MVSSALFLQHALLIHRLENKFGPIHVCLQISVAIVLICEVDWDFDINVDIDTGPGECIIMIESKIYAWNVCLNSHLILSFSY